MGLPVFDHSFSVQRKCPPHLGLEMSNLKIVKVSCCRSYDLSPFAYFDGEVSGNYQVLAVVSNSNHHIKNWSDVRQKKACFPEFGGLGKHTRYLTLNSYIACEIEHYIYEYKFANKYYHLYFVKVAMCI